MQTKIKVGIIGAAGYTGGEMIRILLQHPNIELVFAHSRSNEGRYVYEVHKDLIGESDLRFSSQFSENVSLIFLCLGHGESSKFLKENYFNESVKIIDLSQDFRMSTSENDFVYGLPELNRKTILKASKIANPGCFATAIQLALLPLAKSGSLKNVHITGITGATGAGQQLQSSSHFAWRSNNIQAYKSLKHQHLNEIRQSLSALQNELPEINFVPWRGDFSRGIYLSAYLDFESSIEQAQSLFYSFYDSEPFVLVSKSAIDLKQVVNTNKCLIFLEKESGKLIIHAAIDNLLKGSSGQAVQNMNLMFGLDETTGLKLKSIAF